MPQPADPEKGYSATYDAWNRLVEIADDSTSNTVRKSEYDGLGRRVIQNTYEDGSLDETRHYFYSTDWQVVEERVDTSTDAERQFVWGRRHINDLVCRSRDTSHPLDGTLDETLYCLQDANWNVTGIANASGTIQERYAYEAYGSPAFFDASFGSRVSSNNEWETLYAGYRWDATIGLFSVRNRVYDPTLGKWTRRDPLEYGSSISLYEYVRSRPTVLFDPLGLQAPSSYFPHRSVRNPHEASTRALERIRKDRAKFVNATAKQFKSRKGAYVDCYCKSHGTQRRSREEIEKEFDAAVDTLANAYVDGVERFLKANPLATPAHGRYTTPGPVCADFCDFFIGGSEMPDGAYKGAYFDQVAKENPSVGKFFRFDEGQTHYSWNDTQQHNYTIVYPAGHMPMLDDQHKLSCAASGLVKDPATGNPMRSKDSNIVVFDPWKDLTPWAYGTMDRGRGATPTNRGDVDLPRSPWPGYRPRQ